MSRVGNRISINFPGRGPVHTIDTSFELAGFNREGVVSVIGHAGTKEEFVYGKISTTVINRSDYSVDDFKDLEEVTIVVQDNAGKSWTVRDAFTTEPPKLTENGIELNMEFSSQEEVL